MSSRSAPSTPARGPSNNARKRVCGLLLAVFLNGLAVGLLLAPRVVYQGIAIWGCLIAGLLVMGFAVMHWRDPL